LADNRLAEIAEWNMDLLPLELADLRAADVDLELLGFSSEELEKMLGATGTAGLTDPDAIPEPCDDPITQPGDLWVLGNHRLLCADAGSAADVDRLLDGQKIQLVNTDPPYNVKVEPRSNNAIAAGLSSFGEPGLMHHQSFDLARGASHAHGTTAKMRPKDRPLINDFVSDEAFARMLRLWFGNIARVLVPGRGFYIWGGYANVANYPPAPSWSASSISPRPSSGSRSIRSSRGRTSWETTSGASRRTPRWLRPTDLFPFPHCWMETRWSPSHSTPPPSSVIVAARKSR
jgi:hypothetical protein